MINVPNLESTEAIGDALLREAASSNNPVARPHYFRNRTDVEKALLMEGLGGFDPDTLGDGKKQHYLDALGFAEAATLENAHSLLNTEQQVQLSGTTAATGRAILTATIECEFDRLQIVRSNAALNAAAAAVPGGLPAGCSKCLCTTRTLSSYWPRSARF